MCNAHKEIYNYALISRVRAFSLNMIKKIDIGIFLFVFKASNYQYLNQSQIRRGLEAFYISFVAKRAFFIYKTDTLNSIKVTKILYKFIYIKILNNISDLRK